MENRPSPRDSQLSHLRASVLGEAMSTGQLSHDEYSERLDKLYQAKTVGELQLLTHDLQVDQRPAAANLITPATSSEPDNVIAVFGGTERKGRWRVRRLGRASCRERGETSGGAGAGEEETCGNLAE